MISECPLPCQVCKVAWDHGPRDCPQRGSRGRGAGRGGRGPGRGAFAGTSTGQAHEQPVAFEEDDDSAELGM